MLCDVLLRSSLSDMDLFTDKLLFSEWTYDDRVQFFKLD